MNAFPDPLSNEIRYSKRDHLFEDAMHRLSLLQRDILFDPKLEYKFSEKLGKVEQDPFIGYVGDNYFKSKIRVCFLGKANAETKNPQYDLLINESLLAFRRAKKKSRPQTYAKYRELYADIIPSWDIFRYPKQFLDSLGWNLTDIAYANIVPFRYQHKTISKRVYEISFRNFTNTFLAATAPDVIIPLGKDLKDTIKMHCSVKAEILPGVERVTGDKRIIPESEEYLNAIAHWVKQRMAAHDHI